MGKLAKRVGTGALHALLPWRAVEEVRAAGKSVERMGRMIKEGRDYDASLENASPEELQHRQDRKAIIAEGKSVVLAMEDHDRFQYFVDELQWSEADLANQAKALERSHIVRIIMLYFLLLLTPFIWYQYGALRALNAILLTAYPIVACMRVMVMLIQIEERALWSFGQLRARPGFWFYKRAFTLVGDREDPVESEAAVPGEFASHPQPSAARGAPVAAVQSPGILPEASV